VSPVNRSDSFVRRTPQTRLGRSQPSETAGYFGAVRDPL